MLKILITVWLLLFTQPLLTQHWSGGVRSMGLAHMVSNIEAEGIHGGNIAALSRIEKHQWESLVHVPFGLADLSTFRVGLALHYTIPLSVSFQFFKTKGLSYEVAQMGAAGQWKNIDFGLRLSIYRITIDQQQSVAYTLEYGALLKLNELLMVGLAISNPSSRSIDGITLPGYYFMGVQYQPESFLKLFLETGRTLNRPLTVRWGIEAQIYKQVALRSGFDFKLNSISGGVTWSRVNWQISYATDLHNNLGFSHRWGVGYNW